MWPPQGVEGASGWNVNAQEFKPGTGPGLALGPCGPGAGGTLPPPGEQQLPMMGGFGFPKTWGVHGGVPGVWVPVPGGKGLGQGMAPPEAWQAPPGVGPPGFPQGVAKAAMDGTGAFPGHDAGRAAAQVPRGYVAVWNLQPEYTENELKRDLAEVDFEPEMLSRLHEAEGAFGLMFREEFSAKAIVVALDGIDPKRDILKDSGNRVRLAQWKEGSQDQWGDSDVPELVQSGMAAVSSKLSSVWGAV